MRHEILEISLLGWKPSVLAIEHQWRVNYSPTCVRLFCCSKNYPWDLRTKIITTVCEKVKSSWLSTCSLESTNRKRHYQLWVDNLPCICLLEPTKKMLQIVRTNVSQSPAPWLCLIKDLWSFLFRQWIHVPCAVSPATSGVSGTPFNNPLNYDSIIP